MKKRINVFDLTLKVLNVGQNSNGSDIDTSLCGANYDPDEISVEAGNFKVEDWTVYLLAGIYLGCALLGKNINLNKKIVI